MTKVVVTEIEYRKGKNAFISAEKERLHFISVPNIEKVVSEAISKNKAKAVILGVENYFDPLYKALPKGGIIARFGVGHDGIDKDKATQAGILVTNTPNVLDDSVAEHTIWLMGCLLRRISELNEKMRLGKWEPRTGFELKGRRLAIIGCGAIGCRAAKIASFGFGMNVIGYDAADLDSKYLKKAYGISKFTKNYQEAVKEADIVSVHLASNPSTKHFFSAERLSQIRQGSFFINTSRGAIIDEDALYDCLANGHLAGAGLDVFEKEPYAPVSLDKDLRSLPNIVLTPHIGSSTQEACERMAERCIKNIKFGIENRYEDMDIVNPEVVPELKNRKD